MKPLRLEMTAFGPFRDRVVLDFTDLRDRPFFLIHGPTGAGKTSILDAICFALYGASSGGERQGRQLRCDLAGPEDPTEVTFDFALGSRRYRVRRRPEQERTKKRGEGTTREPPGAELYDLAGREDGAESETGSESDGRLLKAGFKEVSPEMECLLGFRAAEFRQVVVLPQGRFRRLLTADSEERLGILKNLFRTAFYERVERALKDGAREVRKRWESLTERAGWLLGQAGEVLEEPVEDLELLAEHRARLTSEVDALRATRDTGRIEARSALDRLKAGRDLAARFDEKEAAEKEAALLEDRAESVDRERIQVEAATRALALADVDRTRRDRRRDAETARTARQRAVTERDRAEAAWKEAEKVFAREADRGPEREAARKVTDRFESMRDRVARLNGAREDHETACRAAETAHAFHEETAKVLAEVETRRARAETERERIADLAAEWDSRRRKADDLEASLIRLRRRAEATEELIRAERKVYESMNRLRDLEGIRDTARKRRDEAERAFLAGQAEILAGGLVEGEPCPVCGSRKHPDPARTDLPIPERKALETLRSEADRAEAAADRARIALGEREKEVLVLRTGIDALGEADSGDQRGLEKALKQARSEADRAERARASLTPSDEKIAHLKDESEKIRRTLDARNEALAKARLERERLHAVLAEREGEVPESLRPSGELEKALARARDAGEALVKAFQEADRARVEARSALKGAEKQRTEARRIEERARVEAEDAEAAFVREYRARGFENEAAYEAARLDPDDLEALRRAVTRYDADRKAAADRMARAREAVKDEGDRPEVDNLERAYREILERLTGTEKRLGALEERSAKLDRLMADLLKTQKAAEAAETKYRVAGGLAEAASGRNAEGVTFHRFVVGALLDEVLAAASQRLRSMSRGRFGLRRSQERVDRRRLGGLDLCVYDDHSGTVRDVNTLSGGEGFMASLSLALGLSDVVQAYSGGVRLETLFVDEGFGSLDSEALDQALATLTTLESERRLVGIISHVAELRERIDTRLEVLPGRKGSGARFVR